MPVTTVTTPGTTTLIDYYVNVTINMVKRAPRVRTWPGFSPLSSSNSAILFSAAATIGRRDDNFVPNTPLSGTTKYVPISAADGFGVLISPMANATTIVTTTGGYVPTVLYVTWSDIFPVAGTPGTEVPTNIYRIFIPDPTKMPKLCCLEVDLGSPFGTIRIIYENSQVNFSSTTPPAGWVRNQERRNSSGPASGDCFQVYATGSQMCSAYWMGVFSHDGTNWMRNGGFTNSNLPAFKFNYPQNAYPGYNSFLLHWNYQTNSLYTANLTAKGRWRRVRHDDHITYYPQPGAYLGAAFSLAFTDLNPTGTSPQLILTWGQPLTAPTMPSNEYCGLYLELSFTSDYIDSSGGVVTSTYSETRTVFQFRGSSVPEFEIPYAPPSYWPWDIGQKGYGADDATVRWVRHAGYRPVTFPPILSETTVAPTLTRVGKTIILQGGLAPFSGAGPGPNPTAVTPSCTGVVFTTDPTRSNASQMVTSMQIRASSMEWGCEWATPTSGSDPLTIFLQETQEYTLPSGGTPTGVWRLAYQPYNYFYGSLSNYVGPSVTVNDLCSLVNNSNGVAGNIAITSPQYTYPTIRGMAGGSSTTPAKGRIWLSGNPGDAYKITISDGTLIKTFEFDNNSSVLAGNILVTIGASMDATTANLIAAINASGLAITASVPTISDLMMEITLCRIVGQSGGFRQSSKRWTVAAP